MTNEHLMEMVGHILKKLPTEFKTISSEEKILALLTIALAIMSDAKDITFEPYFEEEDDTCDSKH
jgi:hypothetical protein